MRCYLPYANFQKCAECFDNRRLTKQKHAAMEIIYMLKGQRHPSRGDRFFYNSPARKVWQHYPKTLCEYGIAMCDEWERRTGKVCPVKPRIQDYLRYVRDEGIQTHDASWIETEQMHKSHRAILARLEPAHYAQFGWESTPDDEKIFYWPVDEVEALHGTIVRDTRRRDNDRDNDNDDDNSDYSNTDSGDCDCELCRASRG